MSTPPTSVTDSDARLRDRVLRGGVVVGVGLLSAQVAGFIRQLVIGRLLGTGPDADALTAALAPLELCWAAAALMVIYGFVPLFSADTGSGKSASLADVLKPVLRLAALLTGIFLLGAHAIVSLFAPGLSEGSADLAASLLRILALNFAALAFSFTYSAYLLSQRKFWVPSFHTAAVNLGTIVGGAALYSAFGVYGFVAGYALGAWTHMAVALLVLRRGTDDQPAERRQVGMADLLSGPAPILAQALAMEANTAVTRAYASTFGVGMTAAFEYGFKLFRVPVALLVIPLAHSLLPEISSLAQKPGGRLRALRAMGRGSLLLLAGSLAGIAGLTVWGGAAVKFLFEGGQFDAQSTAAVSLVLASYVPAMAGRAITDFLSRSYFGLRAFRTPLFGSFAALVLNAGVCVWLLGSNPNTIGHGAVLGFTVGAAWIAGDLVRQTRQTAATPLEHHHDRDHK